MNKEFVPYQESLELKELGFNEPCFGNWQDMKEETPWFSKSYADNQNQYYGQLCSAPTFSQAFRWFREKYNLFGYPYPNDYQKYGYRIVEVKNPENQELVYDWGTKDTPEEAELACIVKLIEIVKEK